MLHNRLQSPLVPVPCISLLPLWDLVLRTRLLLQPSPGISTANVVEHLGGKVVFCDVDLETFNIDISQVESKIKDRTKVLLPVHLFGLSAEMEPLVELARKHNLWIVEDAACGFGAKFKGNHVGTFGDAGCFSFHPRKAITTGEGGMVTTNDRRHRPPRPRRRRSLDREQRRPWAPAPRPKPHWLPKAGQPESWLCIQVLSCEGMQKLITWRVAND